MKIRLCSVAHFEIPIYLFSSNVYNNHKYKFYLEFPFNDKAGRLDDTSTNFA